MNRNEILTEVYLDNLYKGFAASFYPNLVDEMISELIYSLTTLKEERLISLHNNKELKYYCIAIIRNAAINPKSNFRTSFTSLNVNIDDCKLSDLSDSYILEKDELYKDVFEFLANRSKRIDGAWYDEEIFKMYFEEQQNYRDITEKTKIPVTSVYNCVTETSKVIKQKFKKQYDNIN